MWILQNINGRNEWEIYFRHQSSLGLWAGLFLPFYHWLNKHSSTPNSAIGWNTVSFCRNASTNRDIFWRIHSVYTFQLPLCLAKAYLFTHLALVKFLTLEDYGEIIIMRWFLSSPHLFKLFHWELVEDFGFVFSGW